MTHFKLDARSLAFGEQVARRLCEQPGLLTVAQAQLARWQGQCAPNVQATLAEWKVVLDAGLEETVAVLRGGDERSVRLRQSAPFAGETFISRGGTQRHPAEVCRVNRQELEHIIRAGAAIVGDSRLVKATILHERIGQTGRLEEMARQRLRERLQRIAR